MTNPYSDELLDLWDWCWRRGRDAALEPPVRLHGAYPTADDPKDRPTSLLSLGERRGKPRSAVIVGRPFTRAFERYLDGQKPMTSVRAALMAMKPPKPRPMSLSVLIVWNIVENGYSSPEMLRGVLGCREEVFVSAALMGLRRLRFDTELIERAA